jgi:hypothetical protein
MRYAGLGIQLAVSVLVFVWIGQWLITVVAAFLGFGGTMYWLVRSLSGKDGGE